MVPVLCTVAVTADRLPTAAAAGGAAAAVNSYNGVTLYNNYYNYYNYWGYPMYTPGYTGVPTGGYWATTKVLNLRANLYTSSSKNMVWSAEIAITDPEYVDEASYSVAQKIYSDLGRNQLLGNK